MRKVPFLALLALVSGVSLRADPATPDRLSRYFGGWFAVCPGTRVSVTAAPDIAISGYEAYRVERTCDLKNRNELSIALVDSVRDEVFVGELLYSAQRHDQPFAPAADLPVIQGALQDTYGLPVALRVGTERRGSLIPIRVTIREAPDASASLSGFVSQDGAALLLGEFHPLGVAPEQWRERVLSESRGVSPGQGAFAVTAFIDFQCEKCRQRTPQVRDFVRKQGGSLEIRFLPLVKVHDWAFAAAESAAALSSVSPALYTRYEESIFPRAGAMTEKAARELAVDVADAAGVREGFDAEIASGRARERVMRDVELALRLGLNSTPVFFYRGAFLVSDPNVAETYIRSRLGASEKSSAPSPPR
ncbi:MAG: thioredoxin domain-containing protein [Acidobacteriota bacterium]